MANINERSLTDTLGYPTLPSLRDHEINQLNFKYLTGIVTSDGTYSVGTVGATAANSAATYCSKSGGTNPAKLPVDRTWKVKDDEGNEWYIPLFTYG